MGLAVVEKADFLYLLDETGLSKGNLSSHTTRLEEAGYITIEKAFVEKIPRTVYQLTEMGERALASYRQTLNDSLISRSKQKS